MLFLFTPFQEAFSFDSSGSKNKAYLCEITETPKKKEGTYAWDRVYDRGCILLVQNNRMKIMSLEDEKYKNLGPIEWIVETLKNKQERFSTLKKFSYNAVVNQRIGNIDPAISGSLLSEIRKMDDSIKRVFLPDEIRYNYGVNVIPYTEENLLKLLESSPYRHGHYLSSLFLLSLLDDKKTVSLSGELIWNYPTAIGGLETRWAVGKGAKLYFKNKNNCDQFISSLEKIIVKPIMMLKEKFPYERYGEDFKNTLSCERR